MDAPSQPFPPAGFHPDRDVLSRIPPFTFGNAFAEGWRTLKERYATLLGVSFIYLAAMVVLGYVGDFLDRMIGYPIPSLAMNILLLTPLGAGTFYAGASAVRGGDASVADLFLPFSRYGTVIGVSLLMMIAIWLCAAVAGVGFFALAVLAQGTDLVWLLVIPLVIVLVVVVIYLSVRLYFAPVLAVDPRGPRPGVVDSLRLSWEITAGGTALTLFLLGLCVGLIAIATAMLLFLPLLFLGLPLGLAVYGAAYTQIVADTGVAPRERTDRCHWCGYDVSVTPGDVCPECGGALPPQTPPIVQE